MRLIKSIAIVLLSLVSFSSFAQVEESKAALLELENQLYHKKFSKKWSKLKKENWEAKCNAAKSIKQLNILFNEYSDLMAQMISFSMGNSDATNQLEFAEYLLKVDSILPENLLSKFESFEREKWRMEVSTIIVTEKAAQVKEQQLKKFLTLSKKLKHFNVNAPKIIESSQNSEYLNLKNNSDFINNGEFVHCTYRFEKKANGIDVCIMNYGTEGDALMAKKIMLEFQESLTKKIYPNHKSDVRLKVIDTDQSVDITIVNGIKK